MLPTDNGEVGGVGVSSMTAACFTHPLDLIKVHLQTDMRRTGVSALRATRDVIRIYGLRGLYNGLSAAFLRHCTYTTARFGTYDLCKSFLQNDQGELGLFRMMAAGVVGGVAGGIVGNPAEIMNVRMQHDVSLPPHKQRGYRNAVHGLFCMLRQEGPHSLMHGLGPSLLRAVLATASQLGSYDVAKGYLLRTGYFTDHAQTHLIASLVAGLVATTVCSPADVVKSRAMSMQAPSGHRSPRPNLITILSGMVKNEGWRSLFKGWVPSYVRLCPQLSITLVIYEQLKRWYFGHHHYS
ncbi:hypothetical protein EV182_001088 [Spiromyces aspiralis]|uniref:Uncharacterized protein n=1 Tax=Spiromyces aspiralis TaxID=68401 RepID=A0ACC1HIP1_9FUNG|nr:hypothetical protein EV182_001088 [Spiromyces aspiralis]